MNNVNDSGAWPFVLGLRAEKLISVSPLDSLWKHNRVSIQELASES